MGYLYQPDDLIGKYKIVKLIRDGNFATSYEAIYNKTRLYLKIFSDPTGILPEYERFISYQKIVHQLLRKTSCIPQLMELFEIKISGAKIHCQVFEFIDGMFLENLMKQKISCSNKIRIIKLLLNAVSQIHDLGIVHGDLKPFNILLTKNSKSGYNKLFLTDFEFSRIYPVYNVTTPFYSSPEYLRDSDISFESDIFQLGIILFELLTGYYPYNITDMDDYEKAVDNKKVRLVKDVKVVTKEDKKLVKQMLDPLKKNRPTLVEIVEYFEGKR